MFKCQWKFLRALFKTIHVPVSSLRTQRNSNKYGSAPVSTGNTFQDPQRLREPADNTERYI
jgi:hypothetical protein